jgi:hypothetical protein
MIDPCRRAAGITQSRDEKRAVDVPLYGSRAVCEAIQRPKTLLATRLSVHLSTHETRVPASRLRDV